LMAALADLFLYENTLTGPIPTELGLLTGMTILSLESTQLTGSVPSSVCAFSRLRSIYFYDCGDTADSATFSCTCGDKCKCI